MYHKNLYVIILAENRIFQIISHTQKKYFIDQILLENAKLNS